MFSEEGTLYQSSDETWGWFVGLDDGAEAFGGVAGASVAPQTEETPQDVVTVGLSMSGIFDPVKCPIVSIIIVCTR